MTKDKCYYEAKEKFDVFPSAYASGYIAKCRKKSGKVKKSNKGASLKRWYKEDWKDEKGNVCGSSKNKNTKKCRPSKRVSPKTLKTWKEMSPTEKKKSVAEKKKVGMGKRTSPARSSKGSPKRTKSPKPLYKPFVSTNKSKKYDVYVKSKNDGVKKISFGDRSMQQYHDKIGHYRSKDHNDKKRRQAYRERHRGDHINDKNTPGWWAWHKLW